MGAQEALNERGVYEEAGGEDSINMTFWQENYSFIKEVYDTRYCKMSEWMDNVEMAIQKVCASKVYTSAEFKREKDNFHSLCKNLERAETKKWLTETLETLMKERAPDEQKEEHKKLKLIMERHKTLIPKIQETLVKQNVTGSAILMEMILFRSLSLLMILEIGQ